MALPIHTVGFSDSLVILGAAGLVIPAFARFRVNPVIGFILVGLVVGPAGLGRFVPQVPWLYHLTISDPTSIAPFAQFGIILLLFSIGLELSFARLWAMRRMVFGLGAVELFGAAIVLALAFAALGQNVPGAAGLGLALSLSSTALVLPMVGTASPVGRRAFAMLLFEDVALVPIIFTLGALNPRATGGWQELAWTIGIGTATILALLVAGRLILPRMFGQAARTKSPELFLAASLLVVILASIATTSAGLSPIVGALLAGILIAETDYHREVEAITEPFKGLALGVFLITVGMSLDLSVVASNWLALLGAVAGVVLVKAVWTAGILRITGSRAGVSAEVGLLMASPSETTLIVLATAAGAGLISATTAGFWQIVTAIGLTITPLLAQLGHRMGAQVERSQRAAAAEESADIEGERTVIVGLGRVGRLVAQMLDEHDRPYIAVDASVDAVAHARKRGYAASFGDVARPGIIDRLGLDRANAIILTMDDPVATVRLTRQVRARYPELTIVARARDPNHAAELYKAGATDAVPETVESSLQLSEAVLVDLGVAMGPVIASIHEKRAQLRGKIMTMAKLKREPRFGGRRLRDEA